MRGICASSTGCHSFGRTVADHTGSSEIPLNEWTDLAITFDGFIERLICNGAQVASVSSWVRFRMTFRCRLRSAQTLKTTQAATISMDG